MMIRCQQCNVTKPAAEFNPNTKLDGGYWPWCRDCVAAIQSTTGEERQTLRNELHLAYLRSYQRSHRQHLRLRYFLKDPASGESLGLTYITRTGMVRIAGPWRLNQVAEAILTEMFGVEVTVINRRGRGGGTGNQRQKTFRVEAPVGWEQWDNGLTLVGDVWEAIPVKRLGEFA